MKEIKEYINGEKVKFYLTNTPQITFEVTDACNLQCKYCGYGELYSDYDLREDKRLPINKGVILLDYLNQLWQSQENISYNKNVYISFYGGEPLLNMAFVEAIVMHTKNMCTPNRHFSFSMTTNAILLHKYMDFLVEHKFHLLISLDGNKKTMVIGLIDNSDLLLRRLCTI